MEWIISWVGCVLTCHLDESPMTPGRPGLGDPRYAVPGVTLTPVPLIVIGFLHLLPRHLDARLQVLVPRVRVHYVHIHVVFRSHPLLSTFKVDLNGWRGFAGDRHRFVFYYVIMFVWFLKELGSALQMFTSDRRVKYVSWNNNNWQLGTFSNSWPDWILIKSV